VFADSVYTGERLAKATTIAIEIVRRLPDQVGFQVLPRRWVVERFLAWINRAPRILRIHRISERIPLRRLCHVVGAQACSFGLRFESDSITR
jgi:transposase